MKETTTEDWIARVNAAMDLVLNHRGTPLDLHAVAASVHSSPFHFHRIFRTLTGETLHQFQKRVRLERALRSMARAPHRQLTDIAHAVGFPDSSSFSKAFRSQYGVSPRSFDLKGWKATRREELGIIRLPEGSNPDGFRVRILSLPARTFATIRVHDSFKPGRSADAVARLMAWADERGIEGNWYGWMWEDAELVPLDKCRYDVAVEVGPETKGEGEVRLQQMPPMKVAALSLTGDMSLVQRALDWIFGTWLLTSGKEPAPLPGFEAWRGRPFAHGQEHFELDLHLPIVG